MPPPTRSEVIEFIADYLAIPASRLTDTSTLFGDLGVDGDDGCALLAAFGERFAVDLSLFSAPRYFGPEGYWPWAPLHWLSAWFRSGSPEDKAGLAAITVADLVNAAAIGKWLPKGG